MVNETLISYTYSDADKALIISYQRKQIFKKPFDTRQDAMAFIADKKNRIKVMSAIAKALPVGK